MKIKPLMYLKLTLILINFLLMGILPNCLSQSMEPDELLIKVRIDGKGDYNILSYKKGDTLYLPVKALFKCIKIRAEYDSSEKKVNVYPAFQKAIFVIDFKNKKIIYAKEEIIISEEDIFIKENDIYLRSDLVKSVFSINFVFNFRELMLFIAFEKNLPVFFELKNKLGKDNYLPVFSSDEIIQRKSSLLSGMLINWQLNYIGNSVTPKILGYSLGIGGEVLFGDLQLMLNGSSGFPPDLKYLPIRWKTVFDNNKFLRQITLGDFNTSFGRPLLMQGIQVSNNSLPARKSFSNYHKSYTINPDTRIISSNNDWFIKETVSDTDGRYNLSLPLFYGTNFLKIISEDNQIEEEFFIIPNESLPLNTFEYSVQIGKLKYYNDLPASELVLRYGLLRNLTIGGGLRYINDKRSDIKYYPELALNFRIKNNLIVNTDLLFNDKIKFSLLYENLERFRFDISYSRYFTNRLFNVVNMKEEKSFSAHIPVINNKPFLGMNLYTSETIYQGNYKFLFISSTASVYFSGIGMNLNTLAAYFNPNSDYYIQSFISQLSVSVSAPGGLAVIAQGDKNHRTGKINSARLNFIKSISSSGWISFAVQNDFNIKSLGFNISLHFNLPGAQFDTRVETIAGYNYLQQTARGTLGYDAGYKEIVFENVDFFGRGALTFTPFLDEDGNGDFNGGEKALPVSMKFECTNGRISGLNRVIDLEPYDTCFVYIDPNTVSNPLLKIRRDTIPLIIEPNKFKILPIPLYSVGEINGEIILDQGINKKFLEEVRIFCKSLKDGKIYSSKLFTGNYYYIEELPPGEYECYIDPYCLGKFNLISEPANQKIIIKSNPEGYIVDNINFSVSGK